MPKRPTVPGSLYQIRGRWYWAVRLPGEPKRRARPLVPEGSRFATRRRHVADEIARRIWHRTTFHPEGGSEDETVSGLVGWYLAYAREYYRGSRQVEHIERSAVPLLDLYPTLAAADVGTREFAAVRQRMLDDGVSRRTINQRVQVLQLMFRRAEAHGRVPPGTWHHLQTLEPLKRGRGGTEERAPVGPADEHHVHLVMSYAPPTICAMIHLQLLTGMRSDELCRMRPCDVDRGGDVWLYRVVEHKTAHRGKRRVVLIGPWGQWVLGNLPDCADDEYYFKPAEAMVERGRKPGRTVAERYDRRTYYRAVEYAAKVARKAHPDLPHIHPNQLRHAHATTVEREASERAAQQMLGHSSPKTTRIYVERHLGDAMAWVRESG